MPPRSSGRFLAPLALVVFALALLIVLVDSGGGGGGGTPQTTPTRHSAGGKGRKGTVTSGSTTTSTTTTTPVATARTYQVKPGDILSTIAEKTGVSVARIQALNPKVDPHALVSGQTLKLRP
jgi:LysM repeat protein